MPYNAEFDDSASENRVRSYRDRYLTNWLIVCLLPNKQRTIVDDFALALMPMGICEYCVK
jgi:hypothetical protein